MINPFKFKYLHTINLQVLYTTRSLQIIHNLPSLTAKKLCIANAYT